VASMLTTRPPKPSVIYVTYVIIYFNFLCSTLRTWNYCYCNPCPICFTLFVTVTLPCTCAKSQCRYIQHRFGKNSTKLLPPKKY
jgi:hypothetical protein